MAIPPAYAGRPQRIPRPSRLGSMLYKAIQSAPSPQIVASPVPQPLPPLNPYTMFSINTSATPNGTSQPNGLSSQPQQELPETKRKGQFRFRANDFSINSNIGVNY